MRSFADYRKKELKKTIHSLSFSECMSNSFDILRLDLLEAVKLPELLFENSLITNSIYESARKGDYEDNKQIIEFLVHQFKCGFYQEIIKEANEPNLIAIQVKELIQSLRDSIGSALKASRPVGNSGEDVSGLDPSYDSEGGFAQAANWDAERKRNKWTNKKSSSEEDDEQDFSADQESPNQGSPDPVQGFSNYLQQNKRPQQSPAPSSNPAQSPAPSLGQPQSPGLGIRPKDGYWAGIKRSMIDPAKDWVKSKWQNFKKRWHNQGLGEHSSFLENVMLENFDSIMDILDKFEADMLAIINKIPPSGSGPIPPSNTGPVNPRGSVPSNSPASTDPVTNDKNAADVLNSIPDEVESNAKEAPLNKTEQVKEDNIIKGAIKGAAALGINLNVGNRIRTSSKVRPENFLGQDGQQIGSGYKSVVFAIANLIKDKIEPEFEKEYRAKKSKERGRNYNQLNKTDILPLTLQWLNLPKSGLKNLSVSLLDYYNRKLTGQTAKLTPYSPGNAAEPSGDVTEPMGSNVPVTSGGDATEPNAPAPITAPARGNVTQSVGSNAPISPRGRKSKGQVALDELKKKSDPALFDIYLSLFDNNQAEIAKKFNTALSENPDLDVSGLVNGIIKYLENEYKADLSAARSKKSNVAPEAPSNVAPSNVAPEAPSNVAPANTSPVSPVPETPATDVPINTSAENPTTDSLSKIRAHIDADLADLGVNTSSLDDNALISLIGKNTTIKDLDSDNDGSRFYNKILKKLGVNTPAEETEVPSTTPVEKAAELPTTPVVKSNPLQAGSDEMKAGAPKLSGGLKRSKPKTDTEKSLETPSVGLNKNYFENPAIEAQKQLSGTEGYGKFIQAYKNFVKNNEDEIDYSWEEIGQQVEDDIVSDIVDGMSPKEALEKAKDKLGDEIDRIDKKSRGPEKNKIDSSDGFGKKKADDFKTKSDKEIDAEFSKTASEDEHNYKPSRGAVGHVPGKKLDQMKKEGFNRVLTKFRKLIHS